MIILDETNYISTKVLNDHKIIFNFEMDSRDRAIVLLAGLPSLSNTLRLAVHEPLHQRLVMNYNVERMTKEKGRTYISEKLRGTDCTQKVFEKNAVEAILNSSNSTPQIINKICNSSMINGNSLSLNMIN